MANHAYIFEDVNDALPQLLGDLLAYGDEFGSRAGLTKELTHVAIKLNNPLNREIILPSRKANIAAQIVETMWVLAGRNDVAGLTPYLRRAADFSDDGVEWRAGYGARLRNFHGVDQLAYLVDTLRANPGSRQAVASIWDPTVDTTPAKDIACNNWLSLSSRGGELDLHVGIRSNDAMWGWSGINAFEWSVLLEVVAGLTGLTSGALHFSTTSFHLYDQHWEKARRISNENTEYVYVNTSPRFAAPDTLKEFDGLIDDWFALERAIRTGQPADVNAFPEPMLRSWLRVLQWYWSGNDNFLLPLVGTALYAATQVGVAPAGVPQEPVAPVMTVARPSLLDYINNLHAEKHAAYGDSWKRRGESGIVGNIARKVDRIGSGLDTSDETQTDTAIDLLVYLAKYHCWLRGLDGGPAHVEMFLSVLEAQSTEPTLIAQDFSILESSLERPLGSKLNHVYNMAERAYGYALSLW